MVANAPCRVLVVEDDDDAALALTEALTDDDRVLVVGRARDGVEAVELAAALTPDVVSMDVQMPRLDGLEATRRIRQQSPGVRVIVVSGSMFDDRAEEARDAGACGYLPKARAAHGLAAAVLAAYDGAELFRVPAVSP
jgi:DNA-binding NarL/FixJ family response regulator